MQFNITGIHVEITEAIRTHAQEKIEKFPRFYSSIEKAEVVITADQGQQAIEIIVTDTHGNVFVASEAGADAYTSLDSAAHKIERQLKKKKEKDRDNKHLG